MQNLTNALKEKIEENLQDSIFAELYEQHVQAKFYRTFNQISETQIEKDLLNFNTKFNEVLCMQ